MISADSRVTEVNTSRTGGATIILEVVGERDERWIVTTTYSPEESDYGCLYSDDHNPMGRTEELLLLKLLQEYVTRTDTAKRELNDVHFIIKLIKNKNQ